jgi:hypothetical protein
MTAARSNQEATPLHRSKEWWLAKARAEPDGSCTVGVPDDRDALWSCQQLAASGIEATNDTGPLADIFAEIHRTAAGQLASKEPPVNTVQEATPALRLRPESLFGVSALRVSIRGMA